MLNDLIEELTILWIGWMKSNEMAIDESLTYKERRKAATNAEKLIQERYILIDKMDKFFDEKIKSEEDK